jgi:hypothetical protein
MRWRTKLRHSAGCAAIYDSEQNIGIADFSNETSINWPLSTRKGRGYDCHVGCFYYQCRMIGIEQATHLSLLGFHA